MGGVRLADRLPHALHRGLPGNLYLGRFHDLLFQNGTHRIAPFALDRESGSVLEVDGASGWTVVQALRRGRKHWHCRHDAGSVDFNRAEHGTTLSARAIARPRQDARKARETAGLAVGIDARAVERNWHRRARR